MFISGLVNGFTWMIGSSVIFSLIGCGIDHLAGRGVIFIWPDGSDTPDGATRLGLLLMLLWSMVAFGYGMHRHYMSELRELQDK